MSPCYTLGPTQLPPPSQQLVSWVRRVVEILFSFNQSLFSRLHWFSKENVAQQMGGQADENGEVGPTTALSIASA